MIQFEPNPALSDSDYPQYTSFFAWSTQHHARKHVAMPMRYSVQAFGGYWNFRTVVVGEGLLQQSEIEAGLHADKLDGFLCLENEPNHGRFFRDGLVPQHHPSFLKVLDAELEQTSIRGE